MNIQGKDCTLTVAKDGELIPLPYSEETIRLASKGYVLPGVIGERNREKHVVTGETIQGCFVTRLEYLNVLPLFLLLFKPDDKFDIYTDRVCEKTIYKYLTVKEFELRAENKEAFHLKIEVDSNDDSFVTQWSVTIPELKWEQKRTYTFDGHNVIVDLKTLPLIYRFELTGSFTEKSKYQIKLYFPLSNEHYPQQKKIDKLQIKIDVEDGITIELNDLQPVGNLTDIYCADTVLCSQTYNILGIIKLIIKNLKTNFSFIK